MTVAHKNSKNEQKQSLIQRLKKYLKKIIVMINKDGGGDNFKILCGDTAVMKGDIELIGVPPLRKTLVFAHLGQICLN